jgi:hypothetical protein
VGVIALTVRWSGDRHGNHREASLIVRTVLRQVVPEDAGIRIAGRKQLIEHNHRTATVCGR